MQLAIISIKVLASWKLQGLSRPAMGLLLTFLRSLLGLKLCTK